MASIDRTSPLPYTPAPPPTGTDTPNLSRATWDELFKIAQSLIDLDRPAAIEGASPEAVPVGPTTVYDRLFDEANAVQYEFPSAQLDRTTGIWTCPREGLYLMLPVIEVPAFSTPAGKLFTASLRTTIDRVDGPDEVIVATAGGDDRVPLRLQPIFLKPFFRGDKVYFDLDLTHETKTGNVTVVSVLNIVRQANIR